VINISSIGARAAFPPADYGAAKAALTNLSKALAEEFGPQSPAGAHRQPRPDTHPELGRSARIRRRTRRRGRAPAR
jgi:NAD(P)-dependent dehydrogenase (short-subunit alcohol dehydrogenase family)